MAIQNVEEGLPDKIRVHIVMAEPLRQSVADRVLKAAMIEDVGENERRELGLAMRYVFGFGADLLPYGIDGRHLR